MKRREPHQEPIVDDHAEQKPAVMVEMPDNFAEMTDDEIDAFVGEIWDEFVDGEAAGA
jgi:hypothetical protein